MQKTNQLAENDFGHGFWHDYAVAECRQSGWNQWVRHEREQSKIAQTHPSDLVHIIISMNQSPIWLKYSVPTVESHVEGSETTSQGVQHQHVVDESLPRAFLM